MGRVATADVLRAKNVTQDNIDKAASLKRGAAFLCTKRELLHQGIAKMCELRIIENAGRTRKKPAKSLQKGTITGEKHQENYRVGMRRGVRCHNVVQLRKQESACLNFSPEPHHTPAW